MIELTERQRREYLQRHLANALFDKLSRGRWHVVTSGETSAFKVLGAGQAPFNVSASDAPILYAWLATVSTALPQFDFPMHAILIDSKVYLEFMDQFTHNTRDNWDRLVESGTRKLFYHEDDRLKPNPNVHELMRGIATGLIARLEEMKLIVSVDILNRQEMQDSRENQLIMAALRHR